MFCLSFSVVRRVSPLFQKVGRPPLRLNNNYTNLTADNDIRIVAEGKIKKGAGVSLNEVERRLSELMGGSILDVATGQKAVFQS